MPLYRERGKMKIGSYLAAAAAVVMVVGIVAAHTIESRLVLGVGAAFYAVLAIGLGLGARKRSPF